MEQEKSETALQTILGLEGSREIQCLRCGLQMLGDGDRSEVAVKAMGLETKRAVAEISRSPTATSG